MQNCLHRRKRKHSHVLHTSTAHSVVAFFVYAICSHFEEFGMVKLNKLLLFHVAFHTAIALDCRKNQFHMELRRASKGPLHIRDCSFTRISRKTNKTTTAATTQRNEIIWMCTILKISTFWFPIDERCTCYVEQTVNWLVCCFKKFIQKWLQNWKCIETKQKYTKNQEEKEEEATANSRMNREATGTGELIQPF